MIGVICAILGAALGYRRARKLGGNKTDGVQFAAIFGLIGFLLGMAGTIALDWAGIF